MKTLKHCLSLALLLCSALLPKAQTADEIIDKHIAATGGKEKLSALNSVRMETTIDVMGNTGPGYTVVLNGKGYRNETEFGSDKVVQVITDKMGWNINPFAGLADPTPMSDEEYKAGADQIYIVPLLTYSSRGGKAEYLGQEKVGDVNAYKVKVTRAINVSTTYYFDPSTYYIIQTVTPANFGGQMIDLKASLTDHKKTEYGWVIPYTSTLDFGGQFSLSGKIGKVDINGTVDPALFEMK
jgi:hypothetical protein